MDGGGWGAQQWGAPTELHLVHAASFYKAGLYDSLPPPPTNAHPCAMPIVGVEQTTDE